MLKFFRTLDKYLVKVITAAVTCAMIMIFAITFIQVLMRYVFHVPIGGWDEMPLYAMMLCIWLAASVNAKKKDHISLDLYAILIKKESIRRIIRIITGFLTIVTFSVFIFLLTEFMQFNFERNATTAGLSIPIWIIQTIILFSLVLMNIYFVIGLVREIRGGSDKE